MTGEARSDAEQCAVLGPKAAAAWARGLSAAQGAAFLHDWRWWARPAQLAPEGDWRVWLLMAGRGFGKTRAGAEWVRAIAEKQAVSVALVGATAQDVRRVMVEGESGLLRIGDPARRPVWEPSLGRLRWASGAVAYVYSAAEPDQLRGPSHDIAWADEIAKWPGGDAWDQLMLTMRRGSHPRVVATTTPRPVPLLRRLLGERQVAVTRGRTHDNAAHLPRSYLDAMRESYGGTRLGRQELDGEMLDDVAGALWTRAGIEGARVRELPDLVRVVVAVDPPAGVGGDACGIVAAGVDGDGVAHVIEDASVVGLSPAGWAAVVADCHDRHRADKVVAEANQGGEMVRSVLQAAAPNLPVRLVHATRGKSARAEPVAALYEQGRVRHVGVFPQLEDEMCGMVAGGGYEGPGRSPDRADALVWGLTELMLVRQPVVRIRLL